VTFHEKLRRRVAQLGIKKSRAAREAGLPASTINSYLAKPKSLPRIDIAAKIAKAVNVPLEWLIDDSAGWPPPSADWSDRTVTDASDESLVREVCRRLRLAQIDFLESARATGSIDWVAVTEATVGAESGAELPEISKRAMVLLGSVQAKFNRLRSFDVDFYAILHHSDLPGGNRSIAESDARTCREQWYQIENSPIIKRFAATVRDRPEWSLSPLRLQAERDELEYIAYARKVAEMGQAERERLEKAAVQVASGRKSARRRSKSA
jgi:transcriptional regulator with XRE-family HTH domain